MSLEEAVTLFDQNRKPEMFSKKVLMDDLIWEFGASIKWLNA